MYLAPPRGGLACLPTKNSNPTNVMTTVKKIQRMRNLPRNHQRKAVVEVSLKQTGGRELFCWFKAGYLLMTNNLQGHQQKEEGGGMYRSQRRRKVKRGRKNQKRRWRKSQRKRNRVLRKKRRNLRKKSQRRRKQRQRVKAKRKPPARRKKMLSLLGKRDAVLVSLGKNATGKNRGNLWILHWKKSVQQIF